MWKWAVVVWLGVASQVAHAVEDVDLKFNQTEKENSYSVTVTGVVDATPAAVRHVVLRVCEYKHRYKYFDECVVFRGEGSTIWQYTSIDPPVLDPRDYVSRRDVLQDLHPDGSGVMKIRFAQDHAAGPLPRPGFIRVLVNEGDYEIYGVQGGKKTFIRYSLTLSPGGVVPLWAAKLAARRATPETLKHIESTARDVEKAGGVVMPVAGDPWAGIARGALAYPTANARPAP